MHASIWFALLVAASHCLLLSVWSTWTPKSFSICDYPSTATPNKYSALTFLIPKCITLRLTTLNLTSQVSAHPLTASRASCNADASCIVFISMYSFVSSASIDNLLVIPISMLFINVLNTLGQEQNLQQPHSTPEHSESFNTRHWNLSLYPSTPLYPHGA